MRHSTRVQPGSNLYWQVSYLLVITNDAVHNAYIEEQDWFRYAHDTTVYVYHMICPIWIDRWINGTDVSYLLPWYFGKLFASSSLYNYSTGKTISQRQCCAALFRCLILCPRVYNMTYPSHRRDICFLCQPPQKRKSTSDRITCSDKIRPIFSLPLWHI